MNKRDLTRFKKLLVEQRAQLQGNQKKALTGDIHVDPDNFPDEIDTASSEVSLQFTGRLREREQGLIAKIDRALKKIEEIISSHNSERRRSASCRSPTPRAPRS